MKLTLKPNSGFALLYAVLLTGIILTIGLGLSSILTKQIVLSSIGSNSQKAYYAANSAKECALYWGIHGGVVGNLNGIAFGGWLLSVNADGEESLRFIPPTTGATITCGGVNLPVSLGSIVSDGADLEYAELTVGDFNDGNDVGGLCSKTIVRMYNGDPNSTARLAGNPVSEVRSIGYSTGCSQDNKTRQVEREIVGYGEFSIPFEAVP